MENDDWFFILSVNILHPLFRESYKSRFRQNAQSPSFRTGFA